LRTRLAPFPTRKKRTCASSPGICQPLQGSLHKAIFRLDRIALTLATAGLETGALKLQLKLAPFLRSRFGQLVRHLSKGLHPNGASDASTASTTACSTWKPPHKLQSCFFFGLPLGGRALIIDRSSVAVRAATITDPHFLSAMAAAEQTGQKPLSGPRRALSRLIGCGCASAFLGSSDIQPTI